MAGDDIRSYALRAHDHTEAYESSIDHGALTGLGDDDHPQYANLPKVGTPDYDTILEWINQVGSAGILNDTEYVTNKDADEVTVAAGRGMLRATDSTDGVLTAIEWPSVDLTMPTTQGEVRYIGVEWNAGTPQAVSRTSFDWNWNDDFPLAKVYHDGTNRHIFNANAHSEDIANKTRRFLREVLPLSRTVGVEGGGLILSGTATDVAVTAGKIWHGFNEYDIEAVDTAGAGTFTSYVRASVSPTTWDPPTTGLSTWPNTEYDNGTGLVTMTNNWWANVWWYIEAEDSHLVMLYGRGQYATSAAAQAEAAPNTTPGGLSEHGRLLGRFIFQKGSASAPTVQNTADVVFTTTGVGDHGDLSGLSDDDHTQYIKDTEYTAVSDILIGTGAGTFTVLKNNLAAAVAPTVNEDSGDGYAVGSRWIDTTADEEYVCLDATVGAAVWANTTVGVELAAHLADASDAHDASAISILDTANDFTATDVEGALAELQSDAEAHIAAADPHTGYILESLLDAAGDLIYASANDTPAKLTIGAASTVLTVSGGLPSWQPAAIPPALNVYTYSTFQ